VVALTGGRIAKGKDSWQDLLSLRIVCFLCDADRLGAGIPEASIQELV
jgi:hypothetical protein